MKSRKIADIQNNGIRWMVIKRETDQFNPYWVYISFHDERGNHRKLVAKYADMKSAMYHIYCSI